MAKKKKSKSALKKATDGTAVSMESTATESKANNPNFLADEFLIDRINRGVGGVRITTGGIPKAYEEFFSRAVPEYPIDELKFYQVEEVFDEATCKVLIRLKFLFSHEKTGTSFELLNTIKAVQSFSKCGEYNYDYELTPLGSAKEMEAMFSSKPPLKVVTDGV